MAAQNEEQDARLDSLLTIILDQQAYIDSLGNVNLIADSLQQALIDSANAEIVELAALLESMILTESSTGPTGSVSISLSSANSLEGTLTITASSDAVLMMVSENFFIDAVWEPVATSKAFTFSSTNVFKSVYLKFADANGLIGTAYKESYADIIYPETNPSGRINIIADGITSLIVTPGESYSMTVYVQKEQSIRVRFPYNSQSFGWSFSGTEGWDYTNMLSVSDGTGNWSDGDWAYRDYTTNTLNFYVLHDVPGLNFNSSGSEGTIEIYENAAATPTRTVQITW